MAIAVVVVLAAIGAIFGESPDDANDEATPVDTSDPEQTDPPEETDGPEEINGPEETDGPEETNAPTTEAPTTTESPTTTEAPTTTAAPTTTLPPLPGFGSGTILVGVDADPGIYVAQVPSGSFGCYWERLSDLSGDFEAILANDNVSAGAQAVVELVAGDEAFSSSGCGDWTISLPPDQPETAFGEGTYLVNQQFVPGRYRSSGDPDGFGCYWERQSGVSGDFENIIANDNVEGSAIVDIAPSDFSFKSSGCGDWSLAQ